MLVIFDCDGTLVDSQVNIIRAMEDCFERHRLTPPAPEKIRRIVGLSLVETMQALLPEADADTHGKLAQDYKHAFQRLRAQSQLDPEPLFHGISELLDALEQANVIMAVATGKSDRGLAMCLEHHGIAHYFTTLQTADRHPSKPHPSMIAQCLAETGKQAAECLMVGDTSFDMAMAVNARVTALGVDWGYHAPEELLAHGAAHIISRAQDIALHVR